MAFHGFIEGNDIAEGTVDVVVTDGFTGNIALKTAEGTAKLVGQFLRRSLKRSLLGRIGAFIASGALDTLRRRLDPRAANGGIFLGLSGVVVKSHGGTDAIGFAGASTWRSTWPGPTSMPASPPTAPASSLAQEAARIVIRTRVIGCGAYLPDNIVTNDDLAKTVDTSDEWIRERTGIRQRHIVARRREDLRPGAGGGARGADRCRHRCRRTGHGHLRHHHAGRNLSRHRHHRAGAAGHDAWRGLRRAGGLFRLHLWPVGGRQHDPRRPGHAPSC